MTMLKSCQSNSSKVPRNSLISLWNIIFENISQEWMSFEPSLGLCVYPCYACSHLFSSLNSLRDHVNRRILILRYNCSGCPNGVQTFYNRCSFLLHARDHFGQGQGQINLREIDTFPLPIQFAGFLPHSNISSLYTGGEESVTEEAFIDTQFYNPDISQKGKSIVVMTPKDLLFTRSSTVLALKQICKNIPKCELITLEEQQRLKSLNIERENSHDLDCSMKKEPEEYTAQMTMPVISKIESVPENIFKSPRCLDCNTSPSCTMVDHYRGDNRPTDIRLGCSVCKFVASTECSLLAHTRIHDNEPPHVCPDCGKDFREPELLKEHMNNVCFHLSKNVRFRCPGKKCGKLFATSMTFATHFKGHIKCFLSCSLCTSMFTTIEDVHKHQDDHKEICSFSKVYNCSLCGEIDEPNYIKHIEDHTTDTDLCMYVYMCKNCRSYFRSTTTYATHLLRCSDKSDSTRKKISSHYETRQCCGCHTNIIFNEDNPTSFCHKCKEGEMRQKSLPPKRYFCLLCEKQIQLEEKSNHSRHCKYAKPIVILEDIGTEAFGTALKLVGEKTKLISSPKTEENKRKRKQSHLNIHQKSRRLDKEVEAELIADEPMLFNGTYNCKLCSYVNENRSEFHSHIRSHRDISTAYQCMECGECFVVKPSLTKHLIHFHDISDYHSYFKENDSYDVKAIEESGNLTSWEANGPVKENQCRVCLEEFENSLQLNKHFRIHGMAFLLRNSK
ncbi:hypothetical protein JTB14_013045 [Gonioctena quinquepunctata]|nr:hypothetical protein JTB14_013045 [Gonioctena quinquepunctata]